MFDYHVHTSFSNDCRMPVEEVVERGISLGIQEIAFTDHVELNVWRPGDLVMDDLFDADSYIEKMQAIQKKYKDRMRIKIGVEMGLQLEEKERINQLVCQYPFDFVIGSSHTIEGHDLYYGKLFQEKTKEEAYERYFSEVLKIVKEMDCYSVYGHLDLVRRYALKSYENVELGEQDREMIRIILKEIIEKGKGIEVNTSGFRYGLGSTNPTEEILELYRRMGGEIITVGSDAHRLEHIGFRIRETYALLKEIGFKYITVFEKRKPQFIKL
ncbi:histidinol-phosphatase (PHP family) [Anaerosolibacter carboniphilus]|uniref:Histidinol-phosphatase n=1 Tax=Anaerosolibacter carboniphilus TaxID=1417629 RepID=A0A841KZ67_9FIRM|nr:histidinol-phosphatase HisJ family protein [Anaerosolibacter carboniphilus]MBB6218791.1 histidinol-phosphatase (PHP family) [Anaerosolibacter carboniphilus]